MVFEPYAAYILAGEMHNKQISIYLFNTNNKGLRGKQVL